MWVGVFLFVLGLVVVLFCFFSVLHQIWWCCPTTKQWIPLDFKLWDTVFRESFQDVWNKINACILAIEQSLQYSFRNKIHSYYRKNSDCVTNVKILKAVSQKKLYLIITENYHLSKITIARLTLHQMGSKDLFYQHCSCLLVISYHEEILP